MPNRTLCPKQKLFSRKTRALLLAVTTAFFTVNGLLIPETPAREQRRLALDREGMRPAATAVDCHFTVDPERFLQASARRRQSVSDTTETVRGKSRLQAAAAALPSLEAAAAAPRKNYVDDFVFDRMDEDDVPRAGLSTDEEFLRRVTLDLMGRIPTPDQVRQFLADTSADKRDRKVDELLASPEFTDRWTMFFGDLLKNTAFSTNVRRYDQGRNAFYLYIRDAVASAKPYNLFVQEMIAATGDNFVTGQANFVLGGITPMGPPQDTYDTLAVQTATAFLGLNSFDCLLCHDGANHLDTLNLWGAQAKRMQGWQMAAFFARTQAQRQLVSEQPMVFKYNVIERAAGAYQLNTTDGNRTARLPENGSSTVAPEYIFSGGTVGSGTGYRQAYGQMLTADLQFARAAVNYLWAELMGLGIVDPPDAFDPARQDRFNPPPAPWTLQPSHPELLNALASDFVRANYDLRAVLRIITQSSTYQLSSRYDAEWNELYTPYFPRKYAQRLSAEAMHDAITRATGVLPTYNVAGLPAVQFAMQLPDTVEPRTNRVAQNFLNFFGRGDRDLTLRSADSSITQAMALMNDPFVNQRIRANAPGSLVGRLITQGGSDAVVVDELYLATLSRYPTSAEKTAAMSRLASGTRNAAIEDLHWVLLNSLEFLFNY